MPDDDARDAPVHREGGLETTVAREAQSRDGAVIARERFLDPAFGALHVAEIAGERALEDPEAVRGVEP